MDQMLCTETDRVVALIDRVLSGPRAAPGIVCYDREAQWIRCFALRLIGL